MRGHHGQRGSDSVIQAVAKGVPFERPRGAAYDERRSAEAEALETKVKADRSPRLFHRKRSKSAISGAFYRNRGVKSRVTDLGGHLRSVQFTRVPDAKAPTNPNVSPPPLGKTASVSIAVPSASQKRVESGDASAVSLSCSTSDVAPGRVRCFTCQRVMKEENWERHRVKVHGYTAGVYITAPSKGAQPKRRTL